MYWEHADILERWIIRRRKRGKSSEFSSVYLVDFGLALRSDQARAGSCSGTAGYLAPELIRLQEFDARVDVFSLC